MAKKTRALVSVFVRLGWRSLLFLYTFGHRYQSTLIFSVSEIFSCLKIVIVTDPITTIEVHLFFSVVGLKDC